MSEEYENQSAPQQQLDLYRAKHAGKTPVQLVTFMKSLRDELDAAEEVAKTLRREHEFLAKVLVPETFEEAGIENLKVAGVGRVNLRSDIYASIKSGCKDQAYTFLRDSGRADLIQPTVNASTLKASMKRALENNEPFPEEFFNCTPYTMAVITKA